MLNAVRVHLGNAAVYICQFLRDWVPSERSALSHRCKRRLTLGSQTTRMVGRGTNDVLGQVGQIHGLLNCDFALPYWRIDCIVRRHSDLRRWSGKREERSGRPDRETEWSQEPRCSTVACCSGCRESSEMVEPGRSASSLPLLPLDTLRPIRHAHLREQDGRRALRSARTRANAGFFEHAQSRCARWGKSVTQNTIEISPDGRREPRTSFPLPLCYI